MGAFVRPLTGPPDWQVSAFPPLPPWPAPPHTAPRPGPFYGPCPFPLASMYMAARTLRLADGPDEVHRMVVARDVLRAYRTDR